MTTTEAWPSPLHAADLLHDIGDLAEALDVVASEAVLRTIQASGADVDSESAQAALAAAEHWAIEASQELEGILQSARRAFMTAAQPGYTEP